MIYDLMKKARSLSREEKEFLHDNTEELMLLVADKRKEVIRNDNLKEIDETNKHDFIDESSPKGRKRTRQDRQMDTKQNPDNKKYIPRNYTHLTNGTDSDPANTGYDACCKDSITKISEKEAYEKTAKRLHDPDTVEEMIEIVCLLEKTVKANDDISYDTMSLFLVPLLRGAQRIGLKPYMVVGLLKRLSRICRQYQRTKSKNKSYKDVFLIKKDFNDCLNCIKNRFNSKTASSASQLMKSAQIGDYREAFVKAVENMKLTGLDKEGSLDMLKRMSSALEYDPRTMKSVVEEVFGDIV